MRVRRSGLAAALAALMLSTGCSSVARMTQDDPKWAEKPAPPPAEAEPDLPGAPGGGGPPQEGQPRPGQPPKPGEPDPSVVATKLALPWGLAVMPDGTALVGERTTGRLLRVQPEPNKPVKEVMKISGLDATGDGGLLGIALSPAYREDRLVFAYVTTATDNRIVRFELGGIPQPVLTGIPKSRTGNGGRIAFGPDDHLYVGTGDTGQPSVAGDPNSLAGKVLRVSSLGRPVPGNLTDTSPVYATGFHNVTGLCFDTRKRLYVTDAGTGKNDDELNQVEAGRNYGWPAAMGKAGRSGLIDPLVTFKSAEMSPGGCGSMGLGVFVTALDGARLWLVSLDSQGLPVGTPDSHLDKQYGRLRSVEPAPDGSMWLTTSNKDGRGKPVPDDDRVIHLLPVLVPRGSDVV